MFVFIVLAMVFFENQDLYCATAVSPFKIAIYTDSPNVLADQNTYQCIFVQLQDSNGKLARASEDIIVGLSSSVTTVGTVASAITIPKGETFAAANFTSTFYPGTTTISASATGFATVVSTITTVGPIPSAIAVYGFPAILPADNSSYPAIMVQLQDSNGNPARAPPGGVQVALTCSNTTIGVVTPSVNITAGETCAITNFTPATVAQTEARVLNVTITAASQGYTPNQATISITPVAQNPSKLKIFAGPPKVLADQTSPKLIGVQLQNASGYAATASQNIVLTIASNDSSICQIVPINITAGQTYVNTTMSTTCKPGSANITAVADNFPLTNQIINTFGFIASKLTVYCAPSNVPADGKTYRTVQVQLQDAQGRPAINTGTDVNVKLYSSQPTVGVVSSVLTIPAGKIGAIGNVGTTYTPGNTTITAQVSGYVTGQTTLSTSLIDSYAINASEGTNGYITPYGSIPVMLGGSQRFNITANKGYHISDIFVDNLSQGSISSYTFNNVTEPHTILAQFSINKYTINVTQTANGIIAPGTILVNYGDTPTFTITPNEGYNITSIIVNGKPISIVSVSGQTYQFEPVTANCSLTALYAIKKIPIQVTQTPNGEITPGSTVVTYNSNSTFTITPKTGYHIVDVRVNGTSVGSISSYTAQNIQAATNISATFASNPTPTPTPNATSTPAPTSTPSPSPTPSATPTPNPSSIIKAVTDDGSTVSLKINGNITSQQISNIELTNNQSAATFVLSFALTGENGDVGVCNVTVPKSAIAYGTDPAIYIDGQPAADQRFSEDADYYYVWFSTHFSTHKVSIVFLSPTLQSQSIPQNIIYGIAISVIVATAIIGVVLMRKRDDIKAKFENLDLSWIKRQ